MPAGSLGRHRLGTFIGFITAWMLAKLLAGIFDPPPEVLSIPWLYLTALICIVAVSGAAAVLFAKPSATRDIEYLRDL